MASQQDIEQIQILKNAEQLVATVARAFFDDEAILVIDTLIREKYLKDKDDDLGARLGLLPKQVRSTLARLKEEGLVRSEEMPDEFSGGRKANYWYVDYKHAVNVIRLRTYLMQKALKAQERQELDRQTLMCPKCKSTFTVLEVQRLVNGARGFCCSHCCENDVHSQCPKGPHSLQDFDNRQKLAAVTGALAELKEQLSVSVEPGCSRAGVYDLVKLLHDKPVPSNLPSELRARGIGGRSSAQHGASQLARFQDDRFSMHAVYAANNEQAAAEAATSRGGRSSQFSLSGQPPEIQVVIERYSSDEEDGSTARSSGLPSRRALQRKADEEARTAAEEARRARKVAPSFLVGSRISGGAADAAAAAEAAHDAARSSLSNDQIAAAAAERAAAARAAVMEDAAARKARFKAALEQQRAAFADTAATQSDDGDDEDECMWEHGNGSAGMNGTGKALQQRTGIAFELSSGKTVALEDVTLEDIEAMTAEQYTQYYDAAT